MTEIIDWLDTHAALSGWVQAFGALITLWVAFLIPALQRRDARRDAEAALVPLLSQSVDALTTCGLLLHEEEHPENVLIDVRNVVRRLDGFSADRLRTPLIEPFIQFRAAVEDSLARFEQELREKDQADLIREVTGAITDLSLSSALEHLRAIQARAPRLKLSEAIRNLDEFIRDDPSE